MRTATPVTTHNVHICFVHGTANEKPIWSDKEGIGMLARKTSERRINLADSRGVDDLDLHADGVGGFLHLTQRGLGDRSIGWINEDGDSQSLGHYVVQEAQSFGYQFGDKELTPVPASQRGRQER